MQQNSGRKGKQAGFGALEVMIALIVVIAITANVPRIYSQWFENRATMAAAEHMRIVSGAAAEYIKDNYSQVAANATPAAPAVITTAMLRATGHLQASVSDLNPYGQGYRVLVLQPVAEKLQTLIVTEGGEVIQELSLRSVAKQIGAEGGYVSIVDPTFAEGSYAGWRTSLAPYGVAPGPGHLATALFFQDGALVNDYLYRHAVPGKPELQRMHAAIDMNKNNIDNAGDVNAVTLKSSDRTEVGEFLLIKGVAVEDTSCPQNGLNARTELGLILSCEAGVWTAGAAGLGYKQTWKTVARGAGVVYKNNSKTPIITAPRASAGGAGSYCVLGVYVDGMLVFYGNSGGASYSQSIQPHIIVPPGSTYSAYTVECGIATWNELSSN